MRDRHGILRLKQTKAPVFVVFVAASLSVREESR